MFAAILAAAVLGGVTQDLPPPVAVMPAPPTRGLCERDPATTVSPEVLAARFNDVGTRDYPEQRRAAMAALLTPDALLFNGHDNLTLTSEDFLSLIGIGRPGRLESTVVLNSGGTVVMRSPVGGGREIVTVVRTEGGCIATVATFYD